MRHIAFALLILALGSAGGCASYAKKLPKEDQSAIQLGQAGGLWLSVEPEGLGCPVAVVSFRNVQSGEVFRTGLIVASWDSKHNGRLVDVPSGSYQIIGGECQSETRNGNFAYTSRTDFSDLSNVFGPVDVGNGEIVYPGTLVIRGPKESGTPFDLANQSEFKREGLLKTYPELSDRFQHRPLPIRAAAEGSLQTRRGYQNLQ